MRRRTQAEMDQLVERAGFRKLAQRIDEWGIFTVCLRGGQVGHGIARLGGASDGSGEPASLARSRRPLGTPARVTPR